MKWWTTVDIHTVRISNSEEEFCQITSLSLGLLGQITHQWGMSSYLDRCWILQYNYVVISNSSTAAATQQPEIIKQVKNHTCEQWLKHEQDNHKTFVRNSNMTLQLKVFHRKPFVLYGPYMHHHHTQWLTCRVFLREFPGSTL